MPKASNSEAKAGFSWSTPKKKMFPSLVQLTVLNMALHEVTGYSIIGQFQWLILRYQHYFLLPQENYNKFTLVADSKSLSFTVDEGFIYLL